MTDFKSATDLFSFFLSWNQSRLWKVPPMKARMTQICIPRQAADQLQDKCHHHCYYHHLCLENATHSTAVACRCSRQCYIRALRPSLSLLKTAPFSSVFKCVSNCLWTLMTCRILSVFSWNLANICLVEHRSFSALEGGMSAASFLHSPFLQVINAVMLWPVHVQKVPQASEHLCPAKLQTRCDICCACLPICPFIPTDSSVPSTVDPQKSL